MNLADVPAREALAMALAELSRRRKAKKIEAYYPDAGPFRRELYPKHMAFLAAGATHRVRAAIAANRTGKTEGMGGYELALHLTGRYPAWWTGRRFAKPVRAWACGDTAQTVRDILQEKLLGPLTEPGTGLIQDEALDKASIRMKRGVADAVESFRVKHASGRGWSRCVFKSYDQGREAFQGTEQEVILLDEECPLDIQSECLLRTMTTDGLVMLTFTPLLGITPLIKHLRESGTWEINVTWDDVPHLSKRDREEILRNTPVHLRDARAKGIPLLGSGVIFPVPEESLVVAPFEIPREFARICGMDFGYDHPSGAVELAWDRDADVVYVTKCARMRQASPLMFAENVRPWGAWQPWAWPADGLQHDKGGSCEQLAQQYRDRGLNMLHEFATWEDGSRGVEAGLLAMLDRMQTGRWKVFSTCGEWLEEFRQYHRKDGQIHKLMDDTIDASRYAFMMLRAAETEPRKRTADNYTPSSWMAA